MNNVMFKAFLNVLPVSYILQLVYSIYLPSHVKRCYLRVAKKKTMLRHSLFREPGCAIDKNFPLHDCVYRLGRKQI